MLKKSIFFTSSPAQTRQAGRLLAEELLRTKVDKKARVVELIGDLGTGKTTLLKGFAKALGTKEKILSPTFLIMRKLGGIVCDNPSCRKVCQTYITVKGKKRLLHYCSEQCKTKHYDNSRIQ